MMKFNFPTCGQTVYDCFALDEDKYCHILNNTEFKRPCPFYKTWNYVSYNDDTRALWIEINKCNSRKAERMIN